MSEDTNNAQTSTSSSSKSSNGLMIAAIIVVVGILAVAGYFIYQEYQENQEAEEKIEDMEDEIGKIEDELEDMDKDDDMDADEISDELQEELDSTLAIIRVIRIDLSGDLLEDLALVEEFITDNPEVLEDIDSVDIPADVAAAYERVKEAYDGAVGTSKPPVEEDEEVKVGNKYTITGIIEVAESDDNTLGTLYQVTDEELDVTLYFQFSQGQADDINENMLGEEVTLEIEITEVSDGGVTYKVVSGPELTEEE